MKYLFLLCLITTIVLTGCQKDVVTDNRSSNNAYQTQNSRLEDLSEGKTVSSAHWYGSYLEVNNSDPGPDLGGNPDADETSVYVADSSFIKNGVAELPPFAGTFSFSNISFDIPSNYIISGDSIIYQVVVKNPMSGSFYDYDVVIQLYGDQHIAELHFVADASAQQYNQYYVGNAKMSNLPQLVNYFSDFKTIKLVLKKYQTAAYVNNVLVTNFNYGSANRIGKLKTLNIAGKGYVIVDNVTLTNSVTHKKILSENFNTEGKSHTIFY